MATCCAPCQVGGPCRGRAPRALSALGDLYVSDDDVIAKKDEVNQDVKNVALMEGACPDKLTLDETFSLDSFRRDWFAFYTKPIPLFGAAAEMAATLRYQDKAAQWREILTKRACPGVGPAPAPPPPETGPAAVASQWIGMLKVAIPAAAVIAVVVLAAPVVWEWSAAKKARR